MKKINKFNTGFILRSLAISILALFIWSFFYKYQINEDSINVSLSEKEAKQKALQYIGSRGWDISGFIYSCTYLPASWDQDDKYYYNEQLANKDKEVIKKISQLSGADRWQMRWYNPPGEEEYKISYTKEGELTHFEHVLPDTLSGDSLSENIAINIAKMFLKDMTSSEWKDEDWDLKITTATQKPNRLDYYLQWENNKYDFDGSTIRMSIKVHGNEVTRYNRWLDASEELIKQYWTWDSFSDFYEDISDFIVFIIMIVSILIALFYFKIPTNWQTVWKYTVSILILKILHEILEIPIDIYNFSSKSSLISSVAFELIDAFLSVTFFMFLMLMMLAAFEKLYRKLFPDHISFKNLFNPYGFTSKLFFNNYLAGIVCSLCAISLTSIFYFLVHRSGNYISYEFLDFNDMLTSIPLLYNITGEIVTTVTYVLPYGVVALLVYLFSNSKSISIIATSILFSILPVIDSDPIFISCIYLCLIGLIMGILLFRYGFLSVIIFHFSKSILSDAFLCFYTGDLYYVITGVILIFLLISPILCTLLYYAKYKTFTSSENLLNSYEKIEGEKTSSPIIPKIQEINQFHKKGSFVILIIGIACLFIPNNDELKDFWSFKINKSTAIQTAKETIEKSYNGNLKEFRVGMAFDSNIDWNTSRWRLGVIDINILNQSNFAYLKENLGRSGIKKLFDKYNLTSSGWLIKYFIPDNENYYYAGIDSQNEQLSFYYRHFPDTTAIPSLNQEDAQNLIINTLATQNIDVDTLPIHSKSDEEFSARVDHDISFIKNLSINEQFSIDEIIQTTVSGNLFSLYKNIFKVPEEWQRSYKSGGILFLLCFWLPLMIIVVTVISSIYYLIDNTYRSKWEISWKLLGVIICSITIMALIHFINMIPLYNVWNYGSNSWLGYWLDSLIGNELQNLCIILIMLIPPISYAYFQNPNIKNLFSINSRTAYSKDAMISSIATIGAVLLYRPIKYILYNLFPNYINMTNKFDSDLSMFSTFVPGYDLLSTILIETLYLFVVSIIFYQKFMEYSNNGKKIKKYLILAATSSFYLFYNCFYELPYEMIPHFISRFSGLIILLILIKYFWKGNPLSHLFGILIYLQLDRIFSFIHLADPTLKYQGWGLLIICITLFIYSVGLEGFRSRFLSKAT